MAKNSICIPCLENRPLFDDSSRNVRKYRKRLDSQLIEITRISKNKKHADYEVTSAIWDIDPRFISRNIKVGTATGLVRIDKTTGEITVVYPMVLDYEDKVLSRAKHVLSKAYENGELPEKAGWASG